MRFFAEKTAKYRCFLHRPKFRSTLVWLLYKYLSNKKLLRFSLSDFSLTLVLQIKTSKKHQWHGKCKHKTEKITLSTRITNHITQYPIVMNYNSQQPLIVTIQLVFLVSPPLVFLVTLQQVLFVIPQQVQLLVPVLFRCLAHSCF